MKSLFLPYKSGLYRSAVIWHRNAPVWVHSLIYRVNQPLCCYLTGVTTTGHPWHLKLALWWHTSRQRPHETSRAAGMKCDKCCGWCAERPRRSISLLSLIVTNETTGFLQGQLGGRFASLQASDVDLLISIVVSPYYLNGLCVRAVVCSAHVSCIYT